MIDNYNKCWQNGELKKEEDLLINSPNNSKFTQIKDGIQKNYITKSKSTQENLSENETNNNKINIFPKNEDKKLDLKDIKKSTNEPYYLNKKRRRISKKILFKHRNLEINLNELSNIIHTIIEQVGEKFKLLINSEENKKCLKNICNYCHRSNLNKVNKMINISSPNVFKEFYGNIFNNITNEEYKQKITKISQAKYNIILQNQKKINNIKINNIEEIFQNKNYCFICIYNSLVKNQGINFLWENFYPMKKKIENKTEVEDILVNSNINNENMFNEKNNFLNNVMNKDNINNELYNGENINSNDKTKPNIFDLILGDENDDNNLNDLENLSEDNNSIKNNYNDNKKYDKKNKKYKIEKKKENKILFTKTKIKDNNELNKIHFNNINKSNFELSDKKKNINIINMNNISNINQFNSQKFIKKNGEQTQTLLFNVNHNPNSNNSSKNNIINNNTAIGYLNSINNNMILNNNYDSMYNKLNEQLIFLKNKLSLESNLNDTRIENMNNMNNEIPIIISGIDFKDNLLYFKNSMQTILNYMADISNILEKYSCINEQSLSLIDSLITGNISTDDITKLKNNNNHFLDILNYNYNIKRMNTDLCDKIINYLNH